MSLKLWTIYFILFSFSQIGESKDEDNSSSIKVVFKEKGKAEQIIYKKAATDELEGGGSYHPPLPISKSKVHCDYHHFFSEHLSCNGFDVDLSCGKGRTNSRVLAEIPVNSESSYWIEMKCLNLKIKAVENSIWKLSRLEFEDDEEKGKKTEIEISERAQRLEHSDSSMKCDISEVKNNKRYVECGGVRYFVDCRGIDSPTSLSFSRERKRPRETFFLSCIRLAN